MITTEQLKDAITSRGLGYRTTNGQHYMIEENGQTVVDVWRYPKKFTWRHRSGKGCSRKNRGQGGKTLAGLENHLDNLLLKIEPQAERELVRKAEQRIGKIHPRIPKPKVITGKDYVPSADDGTVPWD